MPTPVVLIRYFNQIHHILKTKQNLYRIISETTGKSMAQVTKDADRDYYMSSEEAKKYGIVDKIITKR